MAEAKSMPPTTPETTQQVTTTTNTTTTVTCHNAVKGEHCYVDLIWAATSGLVQHPEWYPGLSRESTMEDFQALLASDKSKDCPKPCDTNTSLPHVSLFCWSVARPRFEHNVIRMQISDDKGMHQCDSMAVFSNSKYDLGSGVVTIPIQMVPCGVSRDNTAANVAQFRLAWQALDTDGRFRDHDFTVKVDPDAVLIPDRLRQQLMPHVGGTVYVANCDLRDKWPGSPDYPMMNGALEVISKLGMEALIKGESWCASSLPWQVWGEDLYLGHCLQMLKVYRVDNFNILTDNSCRGSDCHRMDAAAYHYFKSIPAWQTCFNIAMGR